MAFLTLDQLPFIPANTPHRFVNTGETTLRQIDIHASPRFIQTNLARVR
jgi:mannose-6-phosphate isomerase-like protein (cupin superfamily)